MGVEGRGCGTEGHQTNLLDLVQPSPHSSPSRLHSQIGAACGKNSCLFSETDKSIQIMQYKTQPESSWKNLFLATVTDPLTSPSIDIQAPFPLLSPIPAHTDPSMCICSLSTLSEHRALREPETGDEGCIFLGLKHDHQCIQR